jgi:hypothetical protein
MGALATLQGDSVQVEPGNQATTEIRVRNTGSVVDQFTFEVLGDAQPWSAVEPATLSLFPGAEETARITFSPPRSPQVPAGQMPFAVRVVSKEDPAGSVVEEGTLGIAPFSDVFAELAPRMSRGSLRATHDLAIDNRGNTPLDATLSASDPDRLLNFDLRPPRISADAGTAVFAKVGVRPKKRFWRGTPQTRPFLVQVEAPGTTPVAIDGTLLQEAMLPRWLVPALVALAGLLVLAVLAWFFLLRPAIESTAREQTESALAAVGITPPPGGFPSGGGGGGGGGGGATSSPSIPPLAGTGVPTDGRLLAGAPLVVEAGKTLYITDLVFTNSSPTAIGDIGLDRSGQQLIVLRLENFRALDFHFVTPIVVPSGGQLTLDCPPPADCSAAAVYYSGYQR